MILIDQCRRVIVRCELRKYMIVQSNVNLSRLYELRLIYRRKLDV